MMGDLSTIEYKGDLRTEAVHLDSGERIHTDAPKDNEGKGVTFEWGRVFLLRVIQK